jgi:hypothetical protein
MSKNNSSGSRHQGLARSDLILVLAWLVSVVPLMSAAVPDDKSPLAERVIVGSLLLAGTVACTAGYRYSSHRNTARLWAAFVFGAITTSTATSVAALAHGTPDVPWGFVIILYTLVYSAGTGIAIAIGVLAEHVHGSTSGTRHAPAPR